MSLILVIIIPKQTLLHRVLAICLFHFLLLFEMIPFRYILYVHFFIACSQLFFFCYVSYLDTQFADRETLAIYKEGNEEWTMGMGNENRAWEWQYYFCRKSLSTL